MAGRKETTDAIDLLITVTSTVSPKGLRGKLLLPTFSMQSVRFIGNEVEGSVTVTSKVPLTGEGRGPASWCPCGSHSLHPLVEALGL